MTHPILPISDVSKMRWVANYPAEAARRFPHRAAIIGDSGTLTYAQLDQASKRFAAYLDQQQIAPGQRISYLGKNTPWFFAVFFACLDRGVILVPINWRCAAGEIAFILEDSAGSLLICDPEFLALARQACAQVPTPPVVLAVDGDPHASLLQLLWSEASHVPSAHHGDPDACAVLMYTSGTTGRPKGVMLSHRALSVGRHLELVSPDWADWNDHDIILSAMPNFHIAGLAWMLIGLARALTCILTADPSAANIINLARRHGVTRTFMVPTVMRAVLDQVSASGKAAPQLRTIYYGAAMMDLTLLTRCMDAFGCGFAQFFGMTENCGAATFLPPAAHDPGRPNLLRSVGMPLAGKAIEIRDAGGRVLAPNEPGEIWISSPTLMLGYWNRPDATAEALVQGWYRSGDGGYLDPHDYLYLTDRIKDMIISGGENIYPAEVEDALRRHPAVAEIVVVGIPDPQWGETVAAFVEWHEGRSASLQELRAEGAKHIASFKLPKILHSVATLPRTPTGKLKRGEVRQQAKQLMYRSGS